jgi:threonine dehydrogenase-like Zn-dependent dehydrogenase
MSAPVKDELVWIIGAGPIGLCCLAVALHTGVPRVVVSDISIDRLRVAEGWGAVAVMNPSETSADEFFHHEMGEAPGIVIDAVGTEQTRVTGVKTVSAGGTVVLVGLHLEESTMPANHIVRNEIVVRGSFGYTQSDFLSALQLLEKGIVKAGEDWLQVRPMEEGQAVFEELVEQRSNKTKVVLDISN